MDWISRLFEDYAGARPARSALLLWRAVAHRSGPRRGRRNSLSRDSRRIGGPRRSLWRPAATAESRRHFTASGNPRHVLHDGSGVPSLPAKDRTSLNFTISENAGTGERLDMLCGYFVVAPPHDRLLRNYLPPRLVVNIGNNKVETFGSQAAAQLAGLVSLMRGEAADDHLGGRAMLNALSTAMFTLALRRAIETDTAPTGLLALAGFPRLAPALEALLTSRHDRGRCQSSRGFAICRVRCWCVNSRRNLGDQPVNS